MMNIKEAYRKGFMAKLAAYKQAARGKYLARALAQALAQGVAQADVSRSLVPMGQAVPLAKLLDAIKHVKRTPTGNTAARILAAYRESGS